MGVGMGMGVHLTGVYHRRSSRVPYECASHRHALHWHTPHRRVLYRRESRHDNPPKTRFGGVLSFFRTSYGGGEAGLT